jgi:hypothetical protein
MLDLKRCRPTLLQHSSIAATLTYTVFGHGRQSASATRRDVWQSNPPTANTRAHLSGESSASTEATAIQPLRLLIGGSVVQPAAADAAYASTVSVATVALLLRVPPMTMTRPPTAAAPAQARRPCRHRQNKRPSDACIMQIH